MQERAGSAVQNPASADTDTTAKGDGRVKSDSRVELEQKSNELEQKSNELEQEVERLRAVVKLNPNVQVI